MARMKRSEQLAAMGSGGRDERPKEFFDQFHERSRTQEPDFAYEWVRVLTGLWALTFFRTRTISSEKVPQSGAVILAPNHGSFMDHFFLAAFIRRKVQFMAKSQLFQPPLQYVYSHGGVFPLRRGHRDEEAFVTARAILERGGAVAMYCEGTRSRDGKLSDRPKPGIGKLALETGAPVVPVAIYGSAKVRNWRKGEFPKVTVQYGDPIRWEPRREPEPRPADGGRRGDLRRDPRPALGPGDARAQGRPAARARAAPPRAPGQEARRDGVAAATATRGARACASRAAAARARATTHAMTAPPSSTSVAPIASAGRAGEHEAERQQPERDEPVVRRRRARACRVGSARRARSPTRRRRAPRLRRPAPSPGTTSASGRPAA